GDGRAVTTCKQLLARLEHRHPQRLGVLLHPTVSRVAHLHLAVGATGHVASRRDQQAGGTRRALVDREHERLCHAADVTEGPATPPPGAPCPPWTPRSWRAHRSRPTTRGTGSRTCSRIPGG